MYGGLSVFPATNVESLQHINVTHLCEFHLSQYINLMIFTLLVLS